MDGAGPDGAGTVGAVAGATPRRTALETGKVGKTAMTVTTERPTRAASRAAAVPPRPGPPTPRAAPAPTSRAALGLLRQAGDGLAEAHRESDPLLRYPAAYLAALRAAAAVLAVRTRPHPKRGAPRDAWRLLVEVAPELGEWAAFFASCSDTRAAAEAGIARLVGRRDADDLLRQAEQFVGIVRELVRVR
jgi:hypothetical protein